MAGAMNAKAGKAAGASLTEGLANYWAPVRYEDLPSSAIAMAKRFLLDNLGAAIAGAKSEVTLIALEAARAAAEGGAGSSVVFGRHATLPAPLAAMVNGTSAHALELDDFGGCGHSGAVVIPVVLALAARGRVERQGGARGAARRLRSRGARARRRRRLSPAQ